MLKECTKEYKGHTPAMAVEAFKAGQGIATHTIPHNLVRLGTQCVLVSRGMRWLKRGDVAFKLMPHGNKSKRSMSSAYIKVKAGKWAPHTREVYLHDLLCWMYNGPPPQDLGVNAIVGHVCEHKLCICPWHLKWMDKSENQARAWHFKKRQRVM